jgi:hypothetical protein
LWRLDSFRDEWLGVIRRVSDRENQAKSLETLQRDFDSQVSTALLNKNRLESMLEMRIGILVNSAAESIPELVDEVGRFDHPAAKVAQLLRKSAKLRELQYETPLKAVAADYNDFMRVQSDYSSLNATRDDHAHRVWSLREDNRVDLEGVRGRLKTFTGNGDDAMIIRAENALNELSPASPSGELWRRFLILQPDVLTLCLVISMGLLGSSLQIAYSALRTTETLGRYFFRLGMGAVTALAIFIVAKAGTPIIADTSRLGGEATVAPYFIAFVAIISGLLSERAILSIQAYGEQVFSAPSKDTLRYATEDLTRSLQHQGLSIDDFAAQLSVKADDLREILTGSVAATGEQQRFISVYLRRPLREIFTDLPASPAAPSTNAVSPSEAARTPETAIPQPSSP